MGPEEPLVRSISTGDDTRVVVAGPSTEDAALYLAANGCDVTTVDTTYDSVERVMAAAEEVGLAARVHGCVGELGAWSPALPVHAVITSPAAFDGLTAQERAHVIAVLQSVTMDGGVHLVRTIMAGQAAISIEELSSRYHGWQISVEAGEGSSRSFLARKSA
jgi:hypothetical protein